LNPTKARLVIEESKESVLVMKVMLARGESIELATGGNLDSLTGVLRIRERKADTGNGNGYMIGSFAFVDASQEAQQQEPAKFQISITMPAKKFDALLKIAISGSLPSKFFVDAGEKTAHPPGNDLTYRTRPEGGSVKVWDNQTYRSLPVTGFTMILPISVPDLDQRTGGQAGLGTTEPLASYAQVAELADDLAVFHSETKHTLIAVVSLIAVMAILALLFNLVVLLG